MSLQQYLEPDELKLIRRFLKTPTRVNMELVVEIVGKLLTNHEVLTETWVDENETVWTRPTPWAYAQNCRVRDEAQARVKLLEKVLMNMQSPSPYTQLEMQQAFGIVQNPDDWKLPVDVVIPNPGEKNLECLTQAIIHFTGSVPQFMHDNKDNTVRVYAAGYYATIGA